MSVSPPGVVATEIIVFVTLVYLPCLSRCPGQGEVLLKSLIRSLVPLLLFPLGTGLGPTDPGIQLVCRVDVDRIGRFRGDQVETIGPVSTVEP